MARRGRKRNPAAKRNQTTAAGQGRTHIDTGTAELTMKRIQISGDSKVSTEFPLDILLARGLISIDQRERGCRFAYLAWTIFGFPLGSCEGIYDRMVSGGAVADARPASGDPEEEDQAKRSARQRREFDGMLSLLRRSGNRRQLNAVQNACQYLRLPSLLCSQIRGLDPRGSDLREMEDLQAALSAMVTANSTARKAA